MPARAPRALLALVAAALVAGCGGSPGATSGTSAETATFAGGTVSPRRAAPPLRLADIDGRSVDLRRMRGGPVLVTFVYARCPDVCPLIMTTLAQARRLAGRVGERTRVVAVSVDPRGDSPALVRRFLRRRGLEGRVDYLIGSRARLEPVWSAWGVARGIPKDDPELIEHSALTYGVTASGEIATAYPVGFSAAQIAQDLPLLAAS